MAEDKQPRNELSRLLNGCSFLLFDLCWREVPCCCNRVVELLRIADSRVDVSNGDDSKDDDASRGLERLSISPINQPVDVCVRFLFLFEMEIGSG